MDVFDLDEYVPPSMLPEAKAKWVEALRSGKYKQGRGVLRNTRDEFCCVGVLFDVSGGKWVESATYDQGKSDCYGADRQVCTGYLPTEFATSVGLHRAVEGDLGRMNDSAGNSFSEIADYIEANL